MLLRALLWGAIICGWTWRPGAFVHVEQLAAELLAPVEVVRRASELYNNAISFPSQSDARLRLLREALALVPRLSLARHTLISDLSQPAETVQSEVARLWEQGVLQEQALGYPLPRVAAEMLCGLGYFLGSLAGDASREQQMHGIELCREAVRVDPTYHPAWYQLGLLLQGVGDEDACAAVFHELLRRAPGHSGALLELGNWNLRRHRVNEAVSMYNEVIAGNASAGLDRYLAMQNKAALLLMVGPKDGYWAEEWLRSSLQAAAAAPMSTTRWYLVVHVGRALGRLDVTSVGEREIHALGRELQRMFANGTQPTALHGALVYAIAGAPSRPAPLQLLLGTHATIAHDAMMSGPELSADRLALLVMASTALHSNPQARAFPAARMQQPDSSVGAEGERSGLEWVSLGPKERGYLRVAYASYDIRPHPMGFMTTAVAAAHNRARVSPSVLFYGPPATKEGWGVMQGGCTPWFAGATTATTSDHGVFTAGRGAEAGRVGGSLGPRGRQDDRGSEALWEQLRPELGRVPCPRSHAFLPGARDVSVLGYGECVDPAVASYRRWLAGLDRWSNGVENWCRVDRLKPWVSASQLGARCVDSMFHVAESAAESHAEPIDEGAETMTISPPVVEAGQQCPLGSTLLGPLLSVAGTDVLGGGLVVGYRRTTQVPRSSIGGEFVRWPWEVPPACDQPPCDQLPSLAYPNHELVSALAFPLTVVAQDGTKPPVENRQRLLEHEALLKAQQGMRLDVLVDMMGYTTHARLGLAKGRPAPVNVQYLGFPGSVMSSSADYVISDRTVSPPERLFQHESARIAHRVIASCSLAHVPRRLRRDIEPSFLLRNCQGYPPALTACRAQHLFQESEALRLEANRGRTLGTGLEGDWDVLPHPNNVLSEGVILLPRTYQVHEKPQTTSVCLQRGGACVSAARQRERVRSALPSLSPRDVVWGHLGSSGRNSEAMLRTWATMLRTSAPHVRLAMIGSATSPVSARYTALFRAMGVSPSRILWMSKLSRSEHVSRLSMMDLVLDSRPYNAHSTAAEALWGGVPLLTMVGDRFESRVGASLLRAAVSQEVHGAPVFALEVDRLLVQPTSKAYQTMGVRLSWHPAMLWELRRKIVRHSSGAVLHDPGATTANIERGIRGAWEVRATHMAREGRGQELQGASAACARVQSPPLTMVAPAPGIARGGWLPFHVVVVEPARPLAVNDAVQRVAVGVWGMATGLSMQQDAACLKWRAEAPRALGGDALLPVGLLPLPRPGDRTGAILRGVTVVDEPHQAPSKGCASSAAVVEEDSSAGVAYNLEGARAGLLRLWNAWHPTDSNATSRPVVGVAHWLQGVVVASAEAWYRRRAATAVVSEGVQVIRSDASLTHMSGASGQRTLLLIQPSLRELEEAVGEAVPSLSVRQALESVVCLALEVGNGTFRDVGVGLWGASSDWYPQTGPSWTYSTPRHGFRESQVGVLQGISDPHLSDQWVRCSEGLVCEPASEGGRRLSAEELKRVVAPVMMSHVSFRLQQCISASIALTWHSREAKGHFRRVMAQARGWAVVVFPRGVPTTDYELLFQVLSGVLNATGLVEDLMRGECAGWRRLQQCGARHSLLLALGPSDGASSPREEWVLDEAALLVQMRVRGWLDAAVASLLVPSVEELGKAIRERSSSFALSLTQSDADAFQVLVSPLDYVVGDGGAGVLGRLRRDAAALGRVCAGLGYCALQASRAVERLHPRTPFVLPNGVDSDAFLPAEGRHVGSQALAYLSGLIDKRDNWEVAELDMVSPEVLAWMALLVPRQALWELRKNSVAELSTDPRRFVPRPADYPTVMLLCDEYGQGWYPQWGPWWSGPVGGSEEAAMQLVKELAGACAENRSACFHVEVYKDFVPDESRGVWATGAVWYPTAWFDPSQSWPPPAVQGSHPRVMVVAWRYPASLGLAISPDEFRRAAGNRLREVTGGRLDKAFVWLHDEVGWQLGSLSASRRALLSGVFFVSAFHASTVEGSWVRIAPNGVDLSTVHEGPNDPLSFIYASAPNRGLDMLLREWGWIREQLPSAQLHVYYGFTQGFMRYLTIARGDQGAKEWVDDVKQLLEQPGVTYHGMVSAEELGHAYARSGFWLYPTSFPETGCIAALKAMASGCVPITSRFPDSALPGITRGFDLGPSLPADVQAFVNDTTGLFLPGRPPGLEEYTRRPEYMRSFARAVVDAVARNQEWTDLRKAMIEHTRTHRSWRATANTFVRAFQE
jgi:predicted O-linked N-acetylglucosamine transferase (SPINDLY family)/glycosyltransferase involved in cell wall biosynthesis/tetratricopeptide (TPR) repeat protein